MGMVVDVGWHKEKEEVVFSCHAPKLHGYKKVGQLIHFEMFGWAFEPARYITNRYSPDLLRQIADKIDELNAEVSE